MRKKQVLALVVTVSVIALSTTACESLTGIAGGQAQDTTGDTAQDTGSLAEADAQDVVEEEKPEEQLVEEEIVVEEPVVINNNEITPVESEDTVSVYGLIGSWTGGGQNVDENDKPATDEDNDYVYTAAIVDIGGDIETYSNEGLYEGEVTAADATDVEIADTEAGHNGIILVDAGNYEITHATITMETEADGTSTCDFSGQGSGILVSGDTYARITDALVSCKGVATMPVFTDNGATTLIDDSTLIAEGGTLYGDYLNSRDQAVMAAPPWTLGVMGTSRASNLMGDDTTMHFVNSTAYAGAWSVLSTDSGSNMYLNIYNSTLELLNSNESSAELLQEPVNSYGGSSQIFETVDDPYTKTYGSGYGSCVTGDAVETFAGTTFNVGTYASVFSGGSATYTGIEEGQTYTLPSAKGDRDYEYTAETSQNTVINSDTFGFMVNQNEDVIDIQGGTEINTGFDTFLVKSGANNESLTANIDGATITNGGVLIQVMDNDDATNGGMIAENDPANTNRSDKNLISTHTENAGFNTVENKADGSKQIFTFSNGEYSGNIYNASGSDNSIYNVNDDANQLSRLGGTDLMVTFDAASYEGAIAQTAAIHVTYDGAKEVRDQGGFAYTKENREDILQYQNTEFDITHYYDIGHVANLINDNGSNTIEVSLQGGSTWTVTGDSLVSGITLADEESSVVVQDGCTLTIGETVYKAGTYKADDFE